MHAVDPTIAAAWISGGVGAVGVAGTVATAWIGSRNTRKATEQVIEASAYASDVVLAASNATSKANEKVRARCAALREAL